MALKGVLRAARSGGAGWRLDGLLSGSRGGAWGCLSGIGARRSYGLAESLMQHHEDDPIGLEDWAGADREALVYRSLEDFTPSGMMMLNGAVFNAPVRTDLVNLATRWQRARWRAGTASSKTRAEVWLSNRKPWPQKGMGKARHGSRASPIWKGGGVSHGPKPKDWEHKMNRKSWQAALRSVLSMKYAYGKLWIIESAELDSFRTVYAEKIFSDLRWRSALIYDDCPLGHWGTTYNLSLATANLPNFQVQSVNGLNVYDISLFNNVVLTQRVVCALELRFEKLSRRSLLY